MNASEKTYQQLKAKIISNELVGAVSESELCATFNVSRTPLREAIFRLITEGWIDYSKNKTKTIRPITLKELKNIFQIRVDIEIMLLNLSWKYHDTSIYQSIKKNIEKGIAQQDIDLLLASDNQLHQQLLDDCNNELVYKMLSFIYDRLRMLRSDKVKTDSILSHRQNILISVMQSSSAIRMRLEKQFPPMYQTHG
ncbi:GntR family transcriptional regulator [Budvicia aquatica]|uniref:Uncharacterized HTH-type transcriptional regulator ydfH n=1 Tax=Budvicia aquatica TaxID=82979 RepID=A0A484ZHI8_9GAMM|nr:GntR family transcriptional regulator [Budvicia aquatica]VFS47605.1 Uncharacterized HTH-type transcriptional regulator ydfH [Budvicia aquatica]